MQVAQQMIACNVRHRTYRAQIDVELDQLKAERSEWQNERAQYLRLLEQIDRLKKEKEDIYLENLRLKENFAKERVTYSATCEELNSFKSYYEAVLLKFQDLRTSNDELKSVHRRLEEELSRLREEPQSSTINSNVRDQICSETVREYRLSQDCHERRLMFSTSFIKYGFYLARSWLETERSGESFLELQWSRQLERYTDEFRDWTDYEPNDENFTAYIERGAHDDLSNLSGPWEPRPQ